MTSLAAMLTKTPLAGSAARAVKAFGAWRKAMPDDDEALLAALLAEHINLAEFLANVFDGSPFLFDLARRDPSRLVRLLSQDPAHSFAGLIESLKPYSSGEHEEAELMQALRLARQEQALLIALADLGGCWDLTAVTEGLSHFAEAATQTVLEALLRRAAAEGRLALADPARPQHGNGYFILGMGKLGGRELNYSSDIDLIAFYEEGKAKLRKADEHQAFFVRLTQQLARILSREDHDGFVFRVDLRLRPDPGTYPLAISTRLALSYYESVGQNWERAAFIKARPVAGDFVVADEFLRDIAPFIWRRYLDYAAIAEIHAMKRLIEESKELSSDAIPGRDVKLGAGGIREIEFFVQTQQLIGGGRDQTLRARPTLIMLDRLKERRWINAETRRDLAEAYEELRRIEHRLQMVEDRQTHRLPTDKKALAAFARFAGFADVKALSRALETIVGTVRAHYGALFENETSSESPAAGIDFSSPSLSKAHEKKLAALGFSEPKRVAETVRGWQAGRYPATRAQTARARLSEITPRLIEAVAKSGEADAILTALDRFLSQLPAGIQFFSLMRSQPAMLDLFTKLLAVAPRLSRDLALRPRLIDGLIDNLYRHNADAVSDIASQLHAAVTAARDYGEALDQARRVAQERIFLIGVHLIAGLLPIEAAGAAYSALAAAVVDTLYRRSIDEHALRFGSTPKRGSAVLALGRLGSREMTATSDVDLLVLYQDEHDALSSGPKELYAAEYYTRLTQRLVAALSAPTAEGIAYAVDFRLRPSGNKGPLATSLRAFIEYHAGEAWTWEHMALTRARIVSSTTSGFEQELRVAVNDVLCRARDQRKLARDVADMRAVLMTEKPPLNPWDIRLMAGGLTDVEFIAQYLVLRHAKTHPALIGLSCTALFAQAAGLGLVAPASAAALAEASAFYTSLFQLARLCLDADKNLEHASSALVAFSCRLCDAADMDELAARRDKHARLVRQCFVEMLKQDPYKV